MDKDKNSAVDEFLGDLKDKGNDEAFNPDNSQQNPFENDNIETKAVEGDKEEQKDEKPLPFNKDPKIQRFIEKEISKRMSEFKPLSTEEKKEDKENLVDAFTAIIGNDTPEKVSALRALERTITDLQDKATSATRQIEAEKQADYEAEQQLQQGLENIEDNFSVDLTSNTPQARKTRTEFLTFVEGIAPKDSNGEISDYPDFEKSFELFQALNKKTLEPNTKARELSSRSMTRSNDSSIIPKPTDQSWNGVEKYLSSLFK